MHAHCFCLLNLTLTHLYLHILLLLPNPSLRYPRKTTETQMRGKFIKQCVQKWRNAAAQALQYAARSCRSCFWDMVSSLEEESSVPEDVPKGHFVVYVGEECERYVIEIKMLKHPLFRTLLDSAEEMFKFGNGPKLHLPCSECVFVGILHCIGSYRK